MLIAGERCATTATLQASDASTIVTVRRQYLTICERSLTRAHNVGDESSAPSIDPVIVNFVEKTGLIRQGAPLSFEPLAGGVSSDIWLVRSPGRPPFCVKRALPRLRVAAEWRADVSRNTSEVAWLKQVGAMNADLVPGVLAADAAIGAFAMEYLAPDRFELWKTRLARGQVEPDTASTVGAHLASIHSAFAKSPAAADDFDTGPSFHALRLEPYLLATARVHTDLASILEDLADNTADTKRTVVHGDISPKNILLGARGPVFVDAECAWFGDPAFDLAFCLNHLLLKTLWVPKAEAELLQSFDVLAQAYLRGVDWEPVSDLERRAAHLLPGLFLARVDGKSPVEYLTTDAQKDEVRLAARAMLKNPSDRLGDVRRRWAERSGRRRSPGAGGDRIDRVVGRMVWDSRGRPTVEAEVYLAGGVRGRAIAPAGASTGRREAVDLRDGGFGVETAVRNVSTEIAETLLGLPILDQEAIDRRLIELDGTPNKARLGGNATIAASMAALHTAAAFRGMPLWQHLAGDRPATLPMPMVQIFGGGAHAKGRLDIQDFLIIPIGASTFREAIAMATAIYHAAGAILEKDGRRCGVADEGGWWPEFDSSDDALDTLMSSIEDAGFTPGVDVAIALDIAATQLRRGSRYRFPADRRYFSTEHLVEHFLAWCRKYPIASIEDPFAEDDDEGMRMFTSRADSGLQIIGDDYLVTSASRVKAAASAAACNAVLLKPNQAGTITETVQALDAARAAGWATVVSARSGETEDVTIVHLAVGWAAGQLKVGSCVRSERTAKWNEAVRIEEALRDRATLSRLPRRRA